MANSEHTWSHDTVIYQIYPRSFCDANGDGIGDLAGITSKLDYLNGRPDSLGVDAIWLSPFYPSPGADCGYDVTNYCDVDSQFGSLDDFKRLLAEAHRRDIRLLVDLVPNHTSDKHPWFLEAVASASATKRDWYIWRDPKPDGSPPNNWLSTFGGSAWQLDIASGQYYLHSFLVEQPDLNWENPAVREALKRVMHFWLDLGVDGFRVDAANYLSKDPALRDDPPNPTYRLETGDDPHHALLPKHSQHGPHLFEYLKELAEVLRDYPDTFMVTEAYADDPHAADKYYTQFYKYVDPAFSAPFNFEAIFTPWRAADFKKFITTFEHSMCPSYVPVYCFGNHDQQRLASRIGRPAARTAAVLQLTLPGVPVIYYGAELGMVDGDIRPDQVHDSFARHFPGLGLGRDPERTPMLWSDGSQAGFTSSPSSWLPINKDFMRCNAAAEQADPDSSLQLYRQLLVMRHKFPALRHGSFVPLEIDNEDVFGYVRETDTEKVSIVLNFSDSKQVLASHGLSGEVALSTHHRSTKLPAELVLEPNEGLIIVSERASGIF